MYVRFRISLNKHAESVKQVQADQFAHITTGHRPKTSSVEQILSATYPARTYPGTYPLHEAHSLAPLNLLALMKQSLPVLCCW